MPRYYRFESNTRVKRPVALSTEIRPFFLSTCQKLAARTTRVCGTSRIKFRGMRFRFPMRWTIYPAKAPKVCLTHHAVWARHANSMRVHWPIPHPNQGSGLFTLWQSEHPINRCLALSWHVLSGPNQRQRREALVQSTELLTHAQDRCMSRSPCSGN